jgi:hypothetical protein
MSLERSRVNFPLNKNLPPNIDRLPHFAPQTKNIHYGPEEALQMKHILVALAVSGNNDLLTDRTHPPSYLFHQMQVITVVEELMREISPHTAAIVAGTHDLGRSVDNNESHIPIGYDIATELGLPKEIANIVLMHHQWGLGIEPFGSAHFHIFANIEEKMGPMQKNPELILNKWKESLGTEDEGIFLASLAVLIADNSKRKTFIATEKEKVPVPVIHVFDEKLGRELINVQLEKGSYKKNSKTHWREYAGLYFTLNMIHYFEKKTGVNYKNAIKKAQERYKTEVEPELLLMWQAEFDLQNGQT